MQDVPINQTLYTLTLLYISNHIIIMLNKECTPTINVHLIIHQCSMSCSCVIMHVVGDDKPCLVDLQI